MRAALFVLCAACATDGEDVQAPAALDARAPDARLESPDAAPSGPTLADCSHFAGVADFHAWLNEERAGYDPHDRWRGIPWSGESHDVRTFSLTFAWDDGLAARADAEARRLAAGGAPAGVLVPGQNGENRDLWVDALGTADWRISAFEQPGDWEVAGFGGHERAALHPSNGSARMALFYHDFGGQGPAIGRVGVGAAAGASCQVAWVLQMGP